MDDLRTTPRGPLAGADLQAHIVSRLDSWEHPPPETLARSDIDLNPDLELGAFEGLRAAAVLIPLIIRDDAVSVLLTRRADTLRRHTGQIAFPGGGIDPGETVWQAALREAHEEVGLSPDLVRLAGIATPFMTLTGFHVTPVVGFVSPHFSPSPSVHEVAEVFEVPFDFLMDAANHVRELREFNGRPPRWVYSIAHEERVIWGITAAIVRNLYERLFGEDHA